MDIAVIGLGYVGTVAAACLAADGHTVTAVDINETKVEQLRSGVSPIVEETLPELVAENVAAGRLRATTDLSEAVGSSACSLICVGTPSSAYGDVRLADLDRVAEEIGRTLACKDAWHLVLLTSTVPPGTTLDRLIPLLESSSGKVCGRDFGVAFSPEFLREGTAVADYRNPPKTVIGASDARALADAKAVFAPYVQQLIETTINVAELAKLVDNAWHALKVAFANEVGRFCDALNIDSHAVMDIFKSDTHLNISTYYLTPGFAFGGSCLPKDLRTLNYRSRQLGVELPVLNSLMTSNQAQVDAIVRRVQGYGVRKIAIAGLAFKNGTDDLRESPALELTERLLGKGYDITVHDQHVNLDTLIGANRDYVLSVLPHVAQLLSGNVEEVLDEAELVIVTQRNPLYRDILAKVGPQCQVLDLTGVARPADSDDRYRGASW